MADIAKLKRPVGKGAPPALEEAPRNTEQAPREKKEARKALQFDVPQSLFDAYGAEAARKFGFVHGSKTRLFELMWDSYLKHNG